MKKTYPDQGLKYIQENSEMSDLKIEDLSATLFDSHLFCYKVSLIYKNNVFAGIGVDTGKYIAASKAISEVLERKLTYDCYLERGPKKAIFSSSFHYDLEEAKRDSLQELIERYTIDAFSKGKGSFGEKYQMSDKEELCRRVLGKDFTISAVTIEAVAGHPVLYCELGLKSEQKRYLGNGVCLLENEESESKALKEALRRVLVFKETKNQAFKEVISSSPWPRESTLTKTYPLDLFESSIINIEKSIKDLGSFSFRFLEGSDGAPSLYSKYVEENPQNLLSHF